MCQLRISPKKCLRACPCVRVILVLVCKTLILVLVWGTYYVPATYIPKKKLARTCVRTWYQHVCIWYQPAPKIRICTYVCTRATSNKKKQNIMPSKRSGCHTRTAPGLHPKTKKEQNAQHTLTERHTHRDRQRFELVPKFS